mmetsp:Transcript_99450/g.221923  ORF Transcript_99450/g.221923 Transcript_99450/m.221923 type:complete len:239 (-) Transcript_99450:36-752(-)
MGVDRDVARHEPHILELVLQVAVLLIAQSLDRRGVDNPLLVPKCHGDGIFSDHCLSSRGVGSDEDGLVLLQATDCLLLEGIELEAILLRRCPGCIARRSSSAPPGAGILRWAHALMDAGRAGRCNRDLLVDEFGRQATSLPWRISLSLLRSAILLWLLLRTLGGSRRDGGGGRSCLQRPLGCLQWPPWGTSSSCEGSRRGGATEGGGKAIDVRLARVGVLGKDGEEVVHAGLHTGSRA